MTDTAQKRSNNFTRDEVCLLVDGVVEFQQALFHKQTNTYTNILKRQRWEEITTRINSVSSQTRTANQIRKKWKDLASLTKKKAAKVRAETKKTGGGSCPDPLTELELKIVSVIGESCVDGVAEGYDSYSSGCSLPSPDIPLEQVLAQSVNSLWGTDIYSFDKGGSGVASPGLELHTEPPAVEGQVEQDMSSAGLQDGHDADQSIQMGPSGDNPKRSRSKSTATPRKKRRTDDFDERFLDIEERRLHAELEISYTLKLIHECLKAKV